MNKTWRSFADTGSEEDLISHSDLEVHFKDKAKKIPSSPVSLITANGQVDADTKHEVYVDASKELSAVCGTS